MANAKSEKCVVKNTMTEMGWYWEHSGMDPESEKWSLCVRTIIAEAKAVHTFG